MGLNFHVACHVHKVTGMVARGHEDYVLHRFFKEHEPCRKTGPRAVEVMADEPDTEPWMWDPKPEGWTELEPEKLVEPVRVEKTYHPVFAGTSDQGEKIVVYKHVDREGELWMLKGNDFRQLTPGTQVDTWHDRETDRYNIVISSASGEVRAKGTQADQIEAEAR